MDCVKILFSSKLKHFIYRKCAVRVFKRKGQNGKSNPVYFDLW